MTPKYPQNFACGAKWLRNKGGIRYELRGGGYTRVNSVDDPKILLCLGRALITTWQYYEIEPLAAPLLTLYYESEPLETPPVMLYYETEPPAAPLLTSYYEM